MFIDRMRETSDTASGSISEIIQSTSSLSRTACLCAHVIRASWCQLYHYRFKPDALKMELIDEITKVRDEEAIEIATQLARKEGLFVGVSSRATTLAAPKVARRLESESKLLVVVLPDKGERYLSTPQFEARQE